MESPVYGFWLHKRTGSALEANRFSRDCAATRPPPGAQTFT
ncbi:DUF6417 family protein [Streptomyces sp. NPDC002623]